MTAITENLPKEAALCKKLYFAWVSSYESVAM